MLTLAGDTDRYTRFKRLDERIRMTSDESSHWTKQRYYIGAVNVQMIPKLDSVTCHNPRSWQREKKGRTDTIWTDIKIGQVPKLPRRDATVLCISVFTRPHGKTENEEKHA